MLDGISVLGPFVRVILFYLQSNKFLAGVKFKVTGESNLSDRPGFVWDNQLKPTDKKT